MGTKSAKLGRMALNLIVLALFSCSTQAQKPAEIVALRFLHKIIVGEALYNSTNPTTGFACTLASLETIPLVSKSLDHYEDHSQRNGYTFEIANCKHVSVRGRDLAISFQAFAVPVKPGRSFCSNEDGEITVDPLGGKNCTEPLDSLTTHKIE